MTEGMACTYPGCSRLMHGIDVPHRMRPSGIRSVEAAVLEAEEKDPIDMVNHPPHYSANASGVEPIQIARHMGFNLGNVIKYVMRAGLKGDALEDLEKAAWYLQDQIDQLRKGTPT